MYYNSQFSGTNPYYWWLGQIVDEVNWGGNVNPKIHNRDDVSGWGYRYKVRIFGRDTQTKETPDDQLEMADVLLPVTAGSGHAGSTQTVNLRQGAYVVGFYKDGIDAREPIITGVLPNNSQTKLFGGDPNLGFVPRSGYLGKTGQKPVSTKNIYSAGPSSIPADESNSPGPQNTQNLPDQYKDGNRCHYIPKTKACDGPGGEVKGVQKLIRQALALINRIKAETNGFSAAVSDLTSGISQIINDISIGISGLLKSLLDRMRGYIVNKLNAGIKDLIDLLPPNQRPGFNQANETATDTFQCVFNKIIRGLVGFVKQLLTDIIDKYINAPLCAVESFMGNFLSSIIGNITNAIQSVLSVIGSVPGIVNKVLDVLNVVSGVLNFLSCDEPLDCTMGDEWSFWGGAKCAADKVSAGIRSTTDNIKKWIDGDGASAPPCNTAQIPCGPPTLAVFGGNGNGILGNPIVSATGSILGIDFVSGGFGYTSPPNIQIIDDCGNGGGAVIVPIMSDTQQTTATGTTADGTTVIGTTVIGTTVIGTTADGNVGISSGSSVVNAVVVDPGNGYLPFPDGSTGANGEIFSKPNDTILLNDKTGYNVYPPDTTISVVSGDTIYTPPGSISDIYDGDGNVVQTIIGRGGTTPISIENSGTFTTPTYNQDQVSGISDSSSNGSYPVVLSIGDVAILNGGVNYNSNDKIVVSPDNGAQLEPVFNDAGKLTDVKVIKSGIGFTEFPNLYIESEQGLNAIIVPVFNILRVGDLPEDQDVIPSGTQIINVVDCVGKVI